MKIAELFADLGFKIQGKEELEGFEKTMNNIAQAARNAALALKMLARTPVPKGFKVPTVAVPAAPGAAVTPAAPAPGMTPPVLPTAPTPAAPGAQPPPLPQKQPPGMSTSVLQGLKSLGMLALKIGGIATVAIALKKLVGALIDMMKASMQATFAVDKFTTQTGLSRRELKEWERIAALSDVKAEQLQETLKALQQRSRQIRWTGEGATPFLQLGIDATASPTEIMKQFAERTKQMDTATAVYFGGLIGISEDMVYMLRKNGDKLKALIPNAELHDEEYRNITELNAAWKELTFHLGTVRDKLMSDVAPAITWIVTQIKTLSQAMTISKGFRNYILSGGMPWFLPQIKKDLQGGTTKIENNIDVNVSGSDKPKETAREVGTALQRQMSDAYYIRTPANAAL